MDTTATPGFTAPNLRALQAIEQTGGITAAAAHLGISSTSIDKHLARLRTVFADDLIVFTGRDTLVTPLGIRVLGLADALFEVYAEIASLAPAPAVPRASVSSRPTPRAAPPATGRTTAGPRATAGQSPRPTGSSSVVSRDPTSARVA